MPEDGVSHVNRSDVLDHDTLREIVSAFASLGVEKVRLTGGEPTLRRDIIDVVRTIKDIPGIKEIALSTNGQKLETLAEPLRQAGVGKLNISIDSLRPDRFKTITRRGDVHAVMRGIEAAAAQSEKAGVAGGFRGISLNAVALTGFNDDELMDLCRFAWKNGAVMRFIEQMPMAGGQLFAPGQLMPAEAIKSAIVQAAGGSGVEFVGGPVKNKGTAGPARYFRVTAPASAQDDGDFGVISPMTNHFCDACNRVRLSANGKLHTCLGYDDAADLVAALAAGGRQGVVARIRAAVWQKREGHVFETDGDGGPDKAMIQIGG